MKCCLKMKLSQIQRFCFICCLYLIQVSNPKSAIPSILKGCAVTVGHPSPNRATPLEGWAWRGVVMLPWHRCPQALWACSIQALGPTSLQDSKLESTTPVATGRHILTDIQPRNDDGHLSRWAEFRDVSVWASNLISNSSQILRIEINFWNLSQILVT